MQSIAVVGIGCRFPQANSPAAYWQLLREGRQAITDVPCDRWQAAEFYHPDHRQQGKMNSCKGGFLDDIDQFDADFFGISPQEAAHMDPQQRLFLEVAWEALEQAGIAPADLSGSATGVFTGLCTIDYHRLLYRDFDFIGPHSGTGTTMSITANRLSYLLNLRGPSMAVDAACSSSTLAVHLACQSLRVQESNLCIVGGVNLILSPDSMISSAKTGLLSVQGACRPFDAAADGYVRGEGCGVVVLKRLADAVADQDNVLAVIKGSAINQDGLSNSLSAPNGHAQKALIENALSLSGVTAADIDYVEAHAVGTPLGDAIEFKSLEKVFNNERVQPCYLGSVKPSIGHLEAASGMAALIKLILALHHEEMPPQLNFEEANTLVNLEKSAFEVTRWPRRWPRAQKPRRASMSTFGFGGTNAHIVLEEAPKVETVPASTCSIWRERSHHILVLTAKNEDALSELACRYQRFLQLHLEQEKPFSSIGTMVVPNLSKLLLPDICFTANTGRSHFNQRLCFVGDSLDDMHRQLAQFAECRREADGEEALMASRFVAGRVRGRKRPKIVFYFPEATLGTLQMGKALYQTQPFFRAVFDICARYSKQDLFSTLLSNANRSDSAALAVLPAERTTGFVVMYAMAKLWQHWGVSPSGMLAEGLGTNVAACMVGLMDVKDWMLQLSAGAEGSIPAPSTNADLQALLSATTLTGCEIVVTVGANRTLAGRGVVKSSPEFVNQTLGGFGSEFWLDANASTWDQLLSHLGRLFVTGVAVAWKAFDQGYQRRRVSLPTYPFERSRHWFTQSESNSPLTNRSSNNNRKVAHSVSLRH